MSQCLARVEVERRVSGEVMQRQADERLERNDSFLDNIFRSLQSDYFLFREGNILTRIKRINFIIKKISEYHKDENMSRYTYMHVCGHGAYVGVQREEVAVSLHGRPLQPTLHIFDSQHIHHGAVVQQLGVHDAHTERVSQT